MYLIIKRILDFILSFAALIVLSPIMLIIAIIIKATDGGKVFFRQRRVGKNKKEFYIYKFRSMRADTPQNVPTHLLQNPESYITPIGRFLRKSSLDELPQLINIIKGEMSIVGPRPALFNQTDLIELREKNGANRLTPGLTGWAQINGRDELPIEVKADFDGEYVEKAGLLFDIKIILKTALSVIKSDGIKEGKG